MIVGRLVGICRSNVFFFFFGPLNGHGDGFLFVSEDVVGVLGMLWLIFILACFGVVFLVSCFVGFW